MWDGRSQAWLKSYKWLFWNYFPKQIFKTEMQATERHTALKIFHNSSYPVAKTWQLFCLFVNVFCCLYTSLFPYVCAALHTFVLILSIEYFIWRVFYLKNILKKFKVQVHWSFIRDAYKVSRWYFLAESWSFRFNFCWFPLFYITSRTN